MLDNNGEVLLSKVFPTVERRVKKWSHEMCKDFIPVPSVEAMQALFRWNVLENENVESSIDYPVLTFKR
jgi:hypothetical protein